MRPFQIAYQIILALICAPFILANDARLIHNLQLFVLEFLCSINFKILNRVQTVKAVDILHVFQSFFLARFDWIEIVRQFIRRANVECQRNQVVKIRLCIVHMQLNFGSEIGLSVQDISPCSIEMVKQTKCDIKPYCIQIKWLFKIDLIFEQGVTNIWVGSSEDPDSLINRICQKYTNDQDARNESTKGGHRASPTIIQFNLCLELIKI